MRRPGTLRAWRVVRLACAAHLTQRLRRACLGHVVGAVPVELRACHGVGQAWDLLQQPVEHPLLVPEHGLGQTLGLGISGAACESGQRGVGGDLEGLRGARVLGVLEHLLLAAGSANQVERGLGQRQGLPDEALQGTESDLERVAALTQLGQPDLETLGVPPRLLKVGLQPVAVLALGGHRDLRLELAHERQLRTMGLVQVLHDLLLLLLSHEKSLSVGGSRR